MVMYHDGIQSLNNKSKIIQGLGGLQNLLSVTQLFFGLNPSISPFHLWPHVDDVFFWLGRASVGVNWSEFYHPFSGAMLVSGRVTVSSLASKIG